MIAVYTFSSAIMRGAGRLDTSDRYPGVLIVWCDVCGVKGMMRDRTVTCRPTGLDVTAPGKLDDIVKLCVGGIALSEHVWQCVRAASLTGMKPRKPKEVVSKKRFRAWLATRQRVHDMGFQIGDVTGRGGSIAESSHVKVIESCSACGWIGYSKPRGRLRIDECQWDGSDFFRVDEYDPVLFTDRAAHALAKARLSNFLAEPAGFILNTRKKQRLPALNEIVSE